MTYSNYVCAKLAVWKSAGKQKLEEFLAKAGISLQQVSFAPVCWTILGRAMLTFASR